MPEKSGFLLIDKPAGWSSFDAVRWLRKLSGIKRIGHTGTLDPFATGLLICALGPVTRLCRFLENADKSYEAVLRLGIQTASGDPEGEVIRESGEIPSEVDAVFLREKLLSIRELPPPLFSAIKIKGRPAYDYARKGLHLELPARPAQILDFELLSYQAPELVYRCRASKGTYIRSLSEYIATSLGTVGYTTSLRRLSIGKVSVDDAHHPEHFEAEKLAANFYPPRKLFEDFEILEPGEAELSALKQGKKTPNPGQDCQRILLLDQTGKALGMAERKAGMLFPTINL
ncbi:MAG: tRNA pseudouridine(55) synthase TruB [Candidatus Cloacimonetes bacterium]|nr:tRNA pseudouridine(55) synthase TruB [Candidatus Cloacimonadota bacterium]